MDSVKTVVVATVAVERKKRQLRSVTEKRQIVEEASAPGASVAVVARAHGVNANQVFAWRKLHLAGKLTGKRSRAVTRTAARLLPVTVSDMEQQLETIATDAAKTPVRLLHAAAVPSGSIHIQFPQAQIRVEGSADASLLRVVLECLLG